jgi:glycosyltransferase involved in cell wall biosynthesis
MSQLDKSSKFSSLSVFFPAYNDALSLPALIPAAFSILEEYVREFEVIVVNDGSRDNTADVLTDLQGQYGPRLRVITHPANRGYGGALRSGFQAARMDYVFYTDGDGQYDVRELPLLLAQARPHIGFVNGFKLKRHDPWHRVLIGRIYNATARTLFRIRISDIDCDYRLIRRELLENLNLTSTSGTICVELVRKVELTGCHSAEVGVHHYPRLYGRSQFFRIQSLLTTLRQFLSLYRRLVIGPAAGAWSRKCAAALGRFRPNLPPAE